MIIVDDNMTFNEKRELKRLIRKTLAELLIPVDIIVKNKEEIDYYKEFIGSVVREALKEGAVI